MGIETNVVITTADGGKQTISGPTLDPETTFSVPDIMAGARRAVEESGHTGATVRRVEILIEPEGK